MLLLPEHRTLTEHKFSKTSRTSSKRLMYIQFTSYVPGVVSRMISRTKTESYQGLKTSCSWQKSVIEKTPENLCIFYLEKI